MIARNMSRAGAVSKPSDHKSSPRLTVRRWAVDNADAAFNPQSSMRSRRIVADAAPLLTIGFPHRAGGATAAPGAAISYVSRLGADTVTVEQYRRACNHIDAEIMQRSPLPYVARSSVDLNAAGLARSWNFDPRLLSGSRPPNAPTRALTMGADSTTGGGDTQSESTRRN